MTFIIAIDPGNVTGVAYGLLGSEPKYLTWDFTPKPKTKKRDADPKHLRYGKLWKEIKGLRVHWLEHLGELKSIHIICEDAKGFMKGKSAVEVSQKYRGVVEGFCAYHNIPYTAIQPADLKRFATGKGVAEKQEMIAVARARYGYNGNEDNEADALIMWHFLSEQLKR
ncbi:MAG TPA: hypothetical protein PLQ75_06805 [Anaerolineales bacterium]|nr:hypothetical protein [Anaerolineales bacterium]